MKYARFVPRADKSTQVTDVVNTDDYNPRPAWGQTDEELLSKLFEPNKAFWLLHEQWFEQTLDNVQAGATFLGGYKNDPLKYINPDNTYGDGSAIPIPVEE